MKRYAETAYTYSQYARKRVLSPRPSSCTRIIVTSLSALNHKYTYINVRDVCKYVRVLCNIQRLDHRYHCVPVREPLYAKMMKKRKKRKKKEKKERGRNCRFSPLPKREWGNRGFVSSAYCSARTTATSICRLRAYTYTFTYIIRFVAFKELYRVGTYRLPLRIIS